MAHMLTRKQCKGLSRKKVTNCPWK